MKNVTASQSHDWAAWHLVTAVCPCVEIRRKNKPKPYDCLDNLFIYFPFCVIIFLLSEMNKTTKTMFQFNREKERHILQPKIWSQMTHICRSEIVVSCT